MRSDGRGITKAVAKPVRARAVGTPPAGMETGEQHAVGVVLGGPGGDRLDCDVGARNVTEHVLY